MNTVKSPLSWSVRRAITIKFGVVRLVVVCKHTTAMRVWGHAPPPPTPTRFLQFRGYEVASETISGPKQCSFSEARRQSFACMNIYPFCPFRHWFRLSDRSLISQATPFADHLEEQKIIGRLSLSHCLQPSQYYVATYHHAVCMPWPFAEHWPYLATPSKPWVRESGLVETRLTRPVTTALASNRHLLLPGNIKRSLEAGNWWCTWGSK